MKQIKSKNGLLDENGSYKPVEDKYKYKSITKEAMNNLIDDIMFKTSIAKKQNVIIYTWEDEKGKCQFLEEFDKAIKEEINRMPFASEQDRQDYINSFNNK